MREWKKQKTEIYENELLKYFSKKKVEEIKSTTKEYDRLENLNNKYRAKSWDAFDNIKDVVKEFISKSKDFFKGVWRFNCFSLVYDKNNFEIKISRKMTRNEYGFLFKGLGIGTIHDLNLYDIGFKETTAHVSFCRSSEKMTLEFKTLDQFTKFMETYEVAIINLDEVKKHLKLSNQNVSNLRKVVATQKNKKKILNAHYKEQKRLREEYEERRRQEKEDEEEYW